MGTLKTSSFLLAAVIVAVGLVACTKDPETSKVSGDVRLRLPWPEEESEGRMSLQIVTLRGIENLFEMKGSEAQFVFAPKIDGETMHGEPSRNRFLKNSSGVYVPLDVSSQQNGVIYAHLERLLALNAELGIGDLLPRPRKVAVAVRMLGDDDEMVYDNSFYDPFTDAILVVPDKHGELPLALNPGVLAHENFHAIFYRLVLSDLVAKNLISKTLAGTAHAEAKIRGFFAEDKKPQVTPPPSDLGEKEMSEERLFRAFLLKAVNEGLADVWGWVYSGDIDFISRSLSSQKVVRSLSLPEGKTARFIPKEVLRMHFRALRTSSNSEGALNSYSYEPGTQIARAVKDVFSEETANREQRKAIAHRLLLALPKISLLFQDEAKASTIGVQEIFKAIFEAEPVNEVQQTKANKWLGVEK